MWSPRIRFRAKPLDSRKPLATINRFSLGRNLWAKPLATIRVTSRDNAGGGGVGRPCGLLACGPALFQGLGFKGWGLGFQGLGFKGWGIRFRVWGLKVGVEGVGFRV